MHIRSHAFYYMIALWMHTAIVKRILAAGDAQETGTLRERIFAQPFHLLQFIP